MKLFDLQQIAVEYGLDVIEIEVGPHKKGLIGFKDWSDEEIENFEKLYHLDCFIVESSRPKRMCSCRKWYYDSGKSRVEIDEEKYPGCADTMFWLNEDEFVAGLDPAEMDCEYTQEMIKTLRSLKTDEVVVTDGYKIDIIKKDVASFENEETGRRWELCMAPYVLEESNCDD